MALPKIPLGNWFEDFVNFLKTSFQGLFDAISTVLDVAIEAFERILLQTADVHYAYVVLAILVGLFASVAIRKKMKKRMLGNIVGILLALGFLVVGNLRYQYLNTKPSPEVFAAAEGSITDLTDSVKVFSNEVYEDAAADLDAAVVLLDRELWSEIEPYYLSFVVDGDSAAALLLIEEQGIPEAFSELPGRAFSDLADDLDEFAGNPSSPNFSAVGRGLERLGGSVYRDIRREWITLQRTLERMEGAEALLAKVEGLEAMVGQIDTRRFQTDRADKLAWYPWVVMMAFLVSLAWYYSGRGLAIFSLIGLLLIVSMGFWESTMQSLALVLSASVFAVGIGAPLGIASAKSTVVEKIVRPILDFMQTMPAFVYLIPAVLFFGLGKVPGAMATVIFAMPPAVRLTSLGIRQVPHEVVEAAEAFGSTPMQLLIKVQLPIALTTILAGLNQTIMLALSMVVIGGMIGAGGLGEDVLSGITQLKIGLGFESGISVVILAIFLDRITQALGNHGRVK